jgi:hypothetical protein
VPLARPVIGTVGTGEASGTRRNRKQNLVGFFGRINISRFKQIAAPVRSPQLDTVAAWNRELGAVSTQELNRKRLEVWLVIRAPCSPLRAPRYHINMPAAAKYAMVPMAIGMP